MVNCPSFWFCLVQRSGVFHAAPALQDEDVKAIVETTAHRVIRLLERRGVLGDTFEYDEFAEEHPVLAGMTYASTRMHVAGGNRAGRPVRGVLQDPAEGVRTGELCFTSRGFSLHAATRIRAGNKQGLERLCNYVARPPRAILHSQNVQLAIAFY